MTADLARVLRIRADTGAIVWSICGTDPARYGTLALQIDPGVSGFVGFSGQHAVYNEGTDLMMLDNDDSGLAGGPRVLRLALSGGIPPTTATIINSCPLVDSSVVPLSCPSKGDGITVPGTMGANVLAMCTPQHVIEELNDSDGTASSVPPLIVSLPATTYCGAGDPGTLDEIDGWYRAFPLLTLGEF